MGPTGQRWRDALLSWTIPDEILAAAPESPHGFPVGLFENAADAPVRRTPSRERALEALPEGGSVLDVGCGAGAASIQLAPPAARLVGMDPSDGMLAAFARRCGAKAVDHTTVHGQWPDIAIEIERCDVVVCHHVLYNVAEIEPFVVALHTHARRRVVIEITSEHPQAWMNPLWLELHGVERPTRPTANDAAAVVAELGIDAHTERSRVAGHTASTASDDHIAFVRKRLCLPAERDDDIREALERHPAPDSRELVTAWWDVSRW